MSTIKDVAIMSETSVGTVSRYLNGYSIKEENRKKIEKAIEKLDFTINPIARGLKTSKTNTVGIIIPELYNVFGTHVVDEMEKTFDKYGYSIIICNSWNNPEKEREKLRFLKDKMVDGIILMPVGENGSYIKEILNSGIPVVQIDRLVKDLSCDGVVTDNINGSYQAVEHLITKGHRRIGIIAGPQEVYTARERLEGYLRALKDYNIEVDENLIVYSQYSYEGGYDAFNKLYSLENKPTVVFVSNYDTTLGAIKALSEGNIKIGEDISILGYDKTELTQIFTPALSLVIQPMDEIGKNAAELLMKRMRGEASGFPSLIRLKTGLVITDSVKTLL